MLVCRHGFCFLLVSVITAVVTTTSQAFPLLSMSKENMDIQLKVLPLIGGPSWLPIHVQVIVDQTYAFDFVPYNATSPNTLRSLLSFQSVPAQARIHNRRILRPRKAKADTMEDKMVFDNIDVPSHPNQSTTSGMGTPHHTHTRPCYCYDAIEFCNRYNKDLHLITNNCWTFAFELIRYLQQQQQQKERG